MAKVWLYLCEAKWVGKRVRRFAWDILMGKEWN